MRKVTDATLAHLLTATDRQRAVTIRYVNAKQEQSTRRIEIHGFFVAESTGEIIIVAWDSKRGDRVHFRLNRIAGYTLHRSAKLAAYHAPVAADLQVCTDEDGEPVGYQAWDCAYVLAA